MQGIWVAGDASPWILGQLPAPLNGGFNCVGYNANDGRPIRFTANKDGWLKPYYNSEALVDGVTFCIHTCYITI